MANNAVGQLKDKRQATDIRVHRHPKMNYLANNNKMTTQCAIGHVLVRWITFRAAG